MRTTGFVLRLTSKEKRMKKAIIEKTLVCDENGNPKRLFYRFDDGSEKTVDLVETENLTEDIKKEVLGILKDFRKKSR